MGRIILPLIIIASLMMVATVNINAYESQEYEIFAIDKQMVPSSETFDGYILYTDMWGYTTHLLGQDKEIKHEWFNNRLLFGMDAHLLENGNLLRACCLINFDFMRLIDLFLDKGKFMVGGTGRIELRDWKGSLLWEFNYLDSQHYMHHDIEPLPNGNVLMIAYEKKTCNEAINEGRNPNILNPEGMWPDHINEVEPTGSSGSNIVWEWHAWDHLIQDYDSSKENFGVIADHPELIDINKGETSLDWLHTNSVDYNEELDQILLSVPHMNEIWIIDHSTTTQQAAGHTGGNSGKGGDLLYRWGNSENYGAGDEGDVQLFHQHDARWIQSGCPGAGHFTVFNSHKEPTSVDEIAPPVDSNGNYYLVPGQAYGPDAPVWSITSQYPYNFESRAYSGVQRLPNGNTLISSADNHSFFVVTPEKNLVWKYDYAIFGIQEVFKMEYYPADYPGVNSYLLNLETVQSSTTNPLPQSQPENLQSGLQNYQSS